MVDKNIELIKITFEESTSIHKFLGRKILVLEKCFAKVSVPFRKELVGDL